MVAVLGYNIGFWTGILAGVFILLHVPSCNTHWAERLGIFSDFLRKYHSLTLDLAVIFAFSDLVLAFIGLMFGIWI